MNLGITELVYLITPFFTWFVTGCTKFVVNSLREKQLALKNIGYGGFPSNHSAIVSAVACLIALQEGISHPAFGVAITLAFIVMMDANSLRQKVGQHAQRINQIQNETGVDRLRERIGHSKIEIAGGIAMGIVCAFLLHACIN